MPKVTNSYPKPGKAYEVVAQIRRILGVEVEPKSYLTKAETAEILRRLLRLPKDHSSTN